MKALKQRNSYSPISKEFLIAQGSCCGSGCQNCPYVDEQGKRYVAGSTKLVRNPLDSYRFQNTRKTQSAGQPEIQKIR